MEALTVERLALTDLIFRSEGNVELVQRAC